MELSKIKVCICEGVAEAAIIDVLLDNNLRIFQREEMLDEGVSRCRGGKPKKWYYSILILGGIEYVGVF